MCLQFGRDKCVKMHIGKRHNSDICPEVKVDTWDEVVINHEGKHEVQDQYIGREALKSVKDKKYLGSILSHDMKNSLNIKEKTDRGVGIVNQIISSISERPYGKHTYRAALLMREAMLIASMLTNSETWINLTQQDLDKLQKPDTLLQNFFYLSQVTQAKLSCSLNLVFYL